MLLPGSFLSFTFATKRHAVQEVIAQWALQNSNGWLEYNNKNTRIGESVSQLAIRNLLLLGFELNPHYIHAYGGNL